MVLFSLVGLFSPGWAKKDLQKKGSAIDHSHSPTAQELLLAAAIG